MDRNWWLPTLSPTKDAMLPQALLPPACSLGSQGGLRSKSPPPLLWALFLIHTSLPRGTRQHQAHGAVTDSMFELQVCALAESTRELLLLLADTGDCMGGWRGREASCKLFLSVFTAHVAQTCNWAAILCFPLCFHIQLLGFASQGSLQLQAGSASCTQHPKFHLLWARRMPVKLWVPSSSGHPPRKTSSEDFHMQTHSHCEQHSALQSKSTSHKHHSPVRVWKSLQPPGKKKYYEKKSEGWINWACSCLLYISDVTKFMLLHRNFFSF